MNMNLFTKNLVNLFYPLHCAGCKIPLEPSGDLCLCAACEAEIRTNPVPYCVKCGRSMAITGDTCDECKKIHFYFSFSRSVFLYEGALKDLIHLFKYKGKIALSRYFSGRMNEFIRLNPYIMEGIDLVISVPMHRRQALERDFNHSSALAAHIAKESGVDFEDTIEKHIATRRQNELSRDERLSNLAGVFRIRKGASIGGLKILLVDDVMTTGATCSACAKTLLDAGAAEVRCLTLARGL